MDIFNLNYSTKNIPTPTDKHYLKLLIEKVEDLIKRMRWKAWHFLNPKKTENNCDKETYGFRTTRESPNVPQLKHFEEDM